MDVRGAAKWIVLACLFVIPFLVLYVSNSLFFPFITGKGFAFRILVEIALAAYAVLALAEPKYRPKFSWTFVLYGAFVVWLFIADALAVSPFKAFWSNFERMDGWVTLVHVFAFFVIAGAVLSADQLWRKWWLTFLSASLLISLYGLMQLSGAFQIHQGGVRLDATLGNAAYLGGYLLFAIAVALWQAMESKGWLRYALYALAAFHAIILFFTATRGAILGAVGAVILGSILWIIESGKTGRRSAAVALIAIVVIIGGFFMLRHSSFVQNEPTLARFASISLADGQTRFTIWNMAWQGFLERPMTGWGQEGFNYIFNTYYLPSMYGQEPWFDRAHNAFLDWLTAGGAPALLLFLAMLGSAVVAFYRKSVTRTERVMLISVVAAYSFQALFIFDNLFSYIPIAAILALGHNASMRPFKSLEKLPALSQSAAATIATPVAIVVGVVVLWFVNVPNIAVAHELLLALSPQSDLNQNLSYFKAAAAENSFGQQEISEQLVSYAAGVAGQTSAPADVRSAVVSYSLEQINKAVMERPKDARTLLEASLAYRAAGDLPDALKATQAALALTPQKQQILIEEATIYWQLGDTKKANEIYQASLALAPEYEDGIIYAAAGDIITGDVATAEKLLMGHFSTTTVDSDILVFAYYQAKTYAPMIQILELRARNVGSVDAGFRLASAYVLVGRYADARAIITTTVAKHPEAAATGQQLLQQLQGK